jgi:exodeoxyribonuclease VII small subunit
VPNGGEAEASGKGLTVEAEEQPLTFEAAFARLEETVRALEAGGLSLAEMISLFEEGMRLVRLCHRELDAGELKVSQLLSGPGGEYELAPLRFEGS